MCKDAMGLISNDWKYLLITETSQKCFIKAFCYNNIVTNKVYLIYIVSNSIK